MNNKESLVNIENKSVSWEEAIKKGVDLLINNGIATKELASSIIDNTNKFGPYYVLMPKVALAHTSPGEYNKKIGMSLILFKEPIKFSAEERHSVNLLFTLSALDGNSHIETLSKFSQLLSDNTIVEQALNACSNKELFEIFKEIF